MLWNLWWLVSGAPIYEAYGLTECCGGCTAISPPCEDPNRGHVGGPPIFVEYKLVDIKDMGYTHKDVDMDGNPLPRGEIYVRGLNVIQGYYKDKKKTLETFENGFLKTGDVG